MAFRVRGMESGVSWMRINQARRGEIGKRRPTSQLKEILPAF
jgi:hypothetical protein